MGRDPAYCFAKLRQWAADVTVFAEEAAWVPDEHGDFGGGAAPFKPYKRQADLLRLLDWLVEQQPDEGVQRRRDAMAKKSRQVGFTASILIWVWHAWLFRPGFSILLTSYEEEAVDKGGKLARIAEHLFGKLRKMQDELLSRCPFLKFNLTDRLSKWERYDMSPTGALKGEDIKNLLTRPLWIVHGEEVFKEARNNTIKGDLPDDATGKSRSYSVALFDEIGEYRAGEDEAAWNSCSPCCRHIFGWGTIPKDAREDSLLFKGTERPGASTTPFWFHWSSIPVYMEGAYFVCRNDKCARQIEWPYASPGTRHVAVSCPCCNTRQSISERELRSPWFDDMCSTFNGDPVSIARYLQGDWESSVGDAVFYTFSPAKSIVPREQREMIGWEPRHGFDPGSNKRSPAAWIFSMFDPETHVLRFEGYWMKHGKPIEWWVPFVAQIPYRTLHQMKVLAGAHVGRMWLEVHQYSELERKIMDHVATFPRGPVRGDAYGNNDHGGAGAAYEVWKRHGVEIHAPRYAHKKRGKTKWDIVEKLRDLYMPKLEIAPILANMNPVDGAERYPALASALSKVRQADTETGLGEPKADFDKRVPKHASHPADAAVSICYDLPNRIEGRVEPSGEIVHKSAHEEDGSESFHGERLGTLGGAGYRRA